jgi:hypothetical protein
MTRAPTPSVRLPISGHDQTATVEERTHRKHRLIKGPHEFRDVRGDQRKKNVKPSHGAGPARSPGAPIRRIVQEALANNA